MKRVILTAALIAAGATAASAWGTSTPDLDRTRARQEARIREGLRDGSLTRREARGLIEEQRRIQALESAARSDGVVTRREHDAIRRAQQDASRHIYQERHDGESRWSRWGWSRWWW
jgi:uncharacterized membrane protein YebE (DUF533 family)